SLSSQETDDILSKITSLGQLSKPWPYIFNADKLLTDQRHRWKMNILHLPPKQLFQDLAARKHVILVGDAAHMLPVFGGEGGNHALRDSVELAGLLTDVVSGKTRMDIGEVGRKFYDGSYDRWSGVVAGTEERVMMMHAPLERWRGGESFVVWKRKEGGE